MTMTTEPIAWLAFLAILAAVWPISQRLRHEDLQPIAAYLLFLSSLGLVSGVVFWGLAWLVLLTGPGAATGSAVVLGIFVIAIVAGLFAGRWIVRFPQWRRMPR